MKNNFSNKMSQIKDKDVKPILCVCISLTILSIIGVIVGTLNLDYGCKKYICETELTPEYSCIVKIIGDPDYGCLTNNGYITSYCGSNSTFTCYKHKTRQCPPKLNCDNFYYWLLQRVSILVLIIILCASSCGFWSLILNKIKRKSTIENEINNIEMNTEYA